MSDSILTSVKKVLGLLEADESFDIDILMHINTVFSTLFDLGIGPNDGFSIEDKTTTWGDFLGDDKRRNNVKTYVCLRVRMFFDPPTTPYLMEAMTKQIQELEWRINVQREATDWVDPNPSFVPTGGHIDGGGA